MIGIPSFRSSGPCSEAGPLETALDDGQYRGGRGWGQGAPSETAYLLFRERSGHRIRPWRSNGSGRTSCASDSKQRIFDLPSDRAQRAAWQLQGTGNQTVGEGRVALSGTSSALPNSQGTEQGEVPDVSVSNSRKLAMRRQEAATALLLPRVRRCRTRKELSHAKFPGIKAIALTAVPEAYARGG